MSEGGLRYERHLAHPCEDGWWWIAASRGLMERMTEDEVALLASSPSDLSEEEK